MNPISRIVEAITGSGDALVAGQPATTGPAAASGDTATPTSPPVAPVEGEPGERSSGPSGLSLSETSTGGADAVPDTPDGVPENYT